MKIKTINKYLFLMLVVIAFIGCSKYKGFKKTDSGLYYKFYVKNTDSIQPKEGDILTLRLAYRLKDSTLYDGKGAPSQIQLKKSDYKGDIFEGLKMMHVGDSATFIVNADSFFIRTVGSQQRPPFVDSNSVLYIDVKLLKAQSQAQIEKETKARNEMLKNKEIVDLKNYISTNKITTAPTSSGLYFIETKKGNGKSPVKGEMVKLNITIKLLDGKPLFSTKDQGKPVEIEYGKPFDNAGVDEAIGMLKAGGAAKLIVPSKIGYGEQGRGEVIAPFTPLLYDIELVSIQSKAAYEKEQAVKKKAQDAEKQSLKAEEPKLLEKYIKDNRISVKPSATGLYYIEVKKGTGKQASAGKTVKVHYTGKLLNGTKFDSSYDRKKPIEFVLGKGQVLPGWDEGIAKMKVGGKAKLIIPSQIGYGEAGAGDLIKPFSTLVFDVELLDVK